MWSTFTSMILLVLHTAQSQKNTKTPQKLHQIVASPGGNIQITCNLTSHESTVTWYKEREDRSLHWIYHSFRKLEFQGKYSGRVPNLTITNVQRNDSGVYYCSINTNWNFRIISVARLIITDTPRPSRSILVPSPLEGAQPDHSVPLLCLTFDANPSWGNFSWDVSEESSQDQKGVGVLDEDGVFSVWHFEMIPREERTEEKADSCLLQEDRSTRARMSTGKGACLYPLYVGIPIIILLLVASFLLLFRKLRARGNSEQGANQGPRRKTPQMDYAEVRYKNRNVLDVD